MAQKKHVARRQNGGAVAVDLEAQAVRTVVSAGTTVAGGAAGATGGGVAGAVIGSVAGPVGAGVGFLIGWGVGLAAGAAGGYRVSRALW